MTWKHTLFVGLLLIACGLAYYAAEEIGWALWGQSGHFGIRLDGS